MTAEEYIKKEFESSILMTNIDHSHCLFLIKDNYYLRMKKLNSISEDNDSDYIYDEKNKEVSCLFMLDFKNNLISINEKFVEKLKKDHNISLIKIKDVIRKLQKKNTHTKSIIEFENETNDYYMNMNEEYKEIFFRTMSIDFQFKDYKVLNNYLDLY